MFIKMKFIALSLIVLVAIAALVFFLTNNHASTGFMAQSTYSQNGSGSSSGQKLQGSQYAQFAYQIYPGQLSSSSKNALAGFSMRSLTLQNGTSEVNLTIGSQTAAEVMVPNGDTLYFIEASIGDDLSNYEGSLGDDGVILVNSNGYIV